MAFNHTLSAILRGRWLIDKQWANDHLPLVLLMLKGQPVSFVDRTGNEGVELPFIIDPATMQRQPMYAYVPDKGYVPNPNLAPNSVGVIPMSGPMTKYNGDCGEPGMIQRTTWLMDMQRRNNVSAIIQMLDTPGGESRAASTYVSVLNRSNKPVLSYVDGMCASLGMWFASSSDEVYLSNELDEMGSIGSFCTLVDFRGYLEKEGIKLIEIYAPQSTDKNKDWRDAINGDTSLIEADLKKHVDAFISFVKNSRGDVASANEKEWNSGKMFYAGDAVKIGLADGVKSFDQVVSKAAWLAKRNKN